MKNFILVLICILMVVIFAGCSLNKQILAHESDLAPGNWSTSLC